MDGALLPCSLSLPPEGQNGSTMQDARLVAQTAATALSQAARAAAGRRLLPAGPVE